MTSRSTASRYDWRSQISTCRPELVCCFCDMVLTTMYHHLQDSMSMELHSKSSVRDRCKSLRFLQQMNARCSPTSRCARSGCRLTLRTWCSQHVFLPHTTAQRADACRRTAATQATAQRDTRRAEWAEPGLLRRLRVAILVRVRLNMSPANSPRACQRSQPPVAVAACALHSTHDKLFLVRSEASLSATPVIDDGESTPFVTLLAQVRVLPAAAGPEAAARRRAEVCRGALHPAVQQRAGAAVSVRWVHVLQPRRGGA